MATKMILFLLLASIASTTDARCHGRHEGNNNLRHPGHRHGPPPPPKVDPSLTAAFHAEVIVSGEPLCPESLVENLQLEISKALAAADDRQVVVVPDMPDFHHGPPPHGPPHGPPQQGKDMEHGHGSRHHHDHPPAPFAEDGEDWGPKGFAEGEEKDFPPPPNHWDQEKKDWGTNSTSDWGAWWGKWGKDWGKEKEDWEEDWGKEKKEWKEDWGKEKKDWEENWGKEKKEWKEDWGKDWGKENRDWEGKPEDRMQKHGPWDAHNHTLKLRVIVFVKDDSDVAALEKEWAVLQSKLQVWQPEEDQDKEWDEGKGKGKPDFETDLQVASHKVQLDVGAMSERESAEEEVEWMHQHQPGPPPAHGGVAIVASVLGALLVAAVAVAFRQRRKASALQQELSAIEINGAGGQQSSYTAPSIVTVVDAKAESKRDPLLTEGSSAEAVTVANPISLAVL